jgi:ADP-ribose pyrophosphatase YjhB (NUDIX family)
VQIKQVFEHYTRKESSTAGDFKYCPFCRAELILKASGQKLRPTCPSCGFIQFKNPAPTVSILIVEGDRVLLGKRRGNPGAGQWAMPSGYIEYDDDFLTTAIREAKEETGLDVEIRSVVHVVSSFLSSGFHFVSLFLLARVVGGELQAADDLDAVDWFPMAGPLPEMAFQEDVDLLEWYSTQTVDGLPVDPDYAAPDR